MTKTRYSKQRELIYENLKARCDHPTAETIYTELKKDNPGLSLGTVYRNLNFLAEAKLIRKLDVGQTSVHFDADLSAHHHFICKECQQVFDIIYVITNGGPGFDTQVLATYTYQSFSLGFLGESSAGSIILAIIVVIISFTMNHYLTKREVEM